MALKTLVELIGIEAQMRREDRFFVRWREGYEAPKTVSEAQLLTTDVLIEIATLVVTLITWCRCHEAQHSWGHLEVRAGGEL